MNVHIANDEKFIDGFIRNVDRFTDTDNIFIIINIYGNVKYVNSKNIIIVENNFNTLVKVIESIKSVRKIYFHSLTELFAEIIERYYGKFRFVWLFFGAEIFMMIENRDNVLMKQTKTILNKIDSSRFQYKLNPTALRREWINYRFYSRMKLNHDFKIQKAISRIDYIGHYIKDDIDQYITKYNPKITWIDWNYYAFDQIESINKGDCKKKYVLLGNSASEFNNHIDAFQRIRNLPENIKLIVPLSYGGSAKYVEEVCRMGFKTYNSNFVPLPEFMDLQSYYQIIKECKAAIFFNQRSQAAGNILTLIDLEIPVFMHEENNLFKFFSQHGVLIFSINDFEDFLEKEFHQKILDRLKENRILIKRIFGEREMSLKYTNLLNI